MPCISDGGADDPCALNNNNDANDGLDKDPSLCANGDTFFLWDEPDTQVVFRGSRRSGSSSSGGGGGGDGSSRNSIAYESCSA